MKNRIKGRGKVFLALIVVLLALVAFTQQAFASSWEGSGSGATGAGVASGAATTYDAPNPVLWRVSLYVSTNADGKIKETDTIEDKLKWVGETIYYSPNMYNEQSNLDYAFVQIESSVPYRVLREGRFNLYIRTLDGSGTYYSTCPVMMPLAYNGGLNTYGETTLTGKLVHFRNYGFDLFNYKYNGDFTTDTDSKLKGSESGKYTSKIIEDMTDSNFWTNVINSIHGNIKAELTPDKNPGMTSIEAAQNRLLPATKDGTMNPECLVDYALVVEPMVMYNCKRDISWNVHAYYKSLLNNDTTYDKHNFAVDAYWLSIINHNYNDPFMTDLGSAYGTTAARCHDTYKPDGQSHHGVICSSVDGTGSWAGIDKSKYAIRGGICLYTITRDTGMAVFFSKNSEKRLDKRNLLWYNNKAACVR